MEINALQRATQGLTAAVPTLPPEKVAETRDLVQAVKALNGSEMFGQNSELMFQMDRGSNRLVIRIVDRKTKETITQVPPEYVLQLARDMSGQAAHSQPASL
jgi:uncharacterized FlaG/YvyC family protein